MLKKYNQFVKSINEEFVDRDILAEGEPSRSPSSPSREVETAPGRPAVSPGQRPSRPSVVPGKSPSVEPAPLASHEEEEGEYLGALRMRELADKLNVPYSEKGLEFEGNVINFFSETEKFHIGKKKFDDVESVITYLKEGNRRPEYKLEGEDRIDPEFEAKSYKFSRKYRL